MTPDKEKEYTEQFKRSLLAIKKLKSELDALKRQQNEPIAIIGMGMKFPGDSNTPDEFWNLLKQGKDATSEVPKDRWNADDYFHPEPGTPGKIVTKRGGFIKDIDKFDNLFFGISHREATYMDPLHRVLLEVAYESLENAGMDLNQLTDTNTSVYMGYGVYSEYSTKHLHSNNPYDIDPYSLTGYMFTAAAGRISYQLGLQGGNVGVTTGCSSSLVSTHLACQSLRTGEADLALAGGINLLITPGLYIALSNMNALSPSGYCKTFDADADG